MSITCTLCHAPGRCSGIVHRRNITFCLRDNIYCTSIHFDSRQQGLAAQSSRQGRAAVSCTGRHSYVFGFNQPSSGSQIDYYWNSRMQEKAGHARLRPPVVPPGPDTAIRPVAHVPAAGALPTDHAACPQRSSPGVMPSADTQNFSQVLVWASAGLTLASFIPSLLAGTVRIAAALQQPALVPIASTAAWLVRPGQLKARTAADFTLIVETDQTRPASRIVFCVLSAACDQATPPSGLSACSPAVG